METIEFPFMVLLRNAPAGMFAYAPKGPSVKIQKSECRICVRQPATASAAPTGKMSCSKNRMQVFCQSGTNFMKIPAIGKTFTQKVWTILPG